MGEKYGEIGCDYLTKATVTIAPLRIARGIQNKILEAISMGLAVVATPQSFEGIVAEAGEDLIIRERAEQFGGSVVQILRSTSLRRYIGGNARKVVEGNYCWTENLRKLGEVLGRRVSSTLPAFGSLGHCDGRE